MGLVVYACRCGYNISSQNPKDPAAAMLQLEAEAKENHRCTFTKARRFKELP